MYLLLFGLIIGRNWETIYNTTSKDVEKVFRALSATRAAITFYYMIEDLYIALEKRLSRKNTIIQEHNILCNCNRRSCRMLKIETYVRKLKAIN